MKNLKIYEENIDKYLLENKENLKYKELLFIKYLENNKDDKYDSFNDYLNNIKEKHSPDINDICLILVPALGLNSLYTGDTNIDQNYINNYARLLDDNADMEKVLKETIYRLRNISIEYASNHNDIDYPIKQIGIFNDILRRYVKLRCMGIIGEKSNDFSLIGKDRCKKELEVYSDIYGNDTVEIIKEYTKELKRDYL